MSTTRKDDMIVVAGAGGFIGGALVRYLAERGGMCIRAVDKKPLPEWYQRSPGVECLCLDLRDEGARDAPLHAQQPRPDSNRSNLG